MAPAVSCCLRVFLAESQKGWEVEHFSKLFHHLNLKKSCIRACFISTVVWVVKQGSKISNNTWDSSFPNHMAIVSWAKKGRSQIFHFGQHSAQGSVKAILGSEEWGLIFHCSCDMSWIIKLILDSSCILTINSLFNQCREIFNVLTSGTNEKGLDTPL